jgi:hypothetical protein
VCVCVCVKTNVQITDGYVINISDERRLVYLHSTQKCTCMYVYVYIYIYMKVLIINEKVPRNVYAIINICVQRLLLQCCHSILLIRQTVFDEDMHDE